MRIKMILMTFLFIFIIALLSGCASKELANEQKELIEKLGNIEDNVSLSVDCSNNSGSSNNNNNNNNCNFGENNNSDSKQNNVSETNISQQIPVITTTCGDRVCQDYESCDICAQDCCSAPSVTLGDYPGIAEEMIPVVGDKSSSKSVIALSEIIFSLNGEGITMGEYRLASEVGSLDGENYLLIGTPCDNELVASFYEYTKQINSGNCRVFTSGVGILRIVPTSDDNYVIIVTGNTEDDVMKAALILKNNDDYDMDGMEFTTQ